MPTKCFRPYLIHDALERVIGSHEFSGSDRKKRFLEFIVQETLAGHANRIKAYTIAVDVLGRDQVSIRRPTRWYGSRPVGCAVAWSTTT